MGGWGDSHLHIDINLVDVQPSAGVRPLAPHSLFKHTRSHTNTLEKKTIYQQSSLSSLSLHSCSVHARRRGFSRTSPPAARGGSGYQAPTAGSCVSPPGLDEEPSPSPPGTGPSCPRRRTPVGEHKPRLSAAQCRFKH